MLRHVLASYDAVDVNAPDTAGDAPLHLAADQGSVDMARALLAAGADVNLRRVDARTLAGSPGGAPHK